MIHVDNNTPIAMLTVGQLKDVLESVDKKEIEVKDKYKNYVYGLSGLANLFSCSIPTAARIKASGKIDAAIKQIGRKIIVDADLALDLAGRKTGGRK